MAVARGDGYAGFPVARGGGRIGLAALPRLLDRPLTSYYLILGCTALLVALGLLMVLSASMIEQLRDTGSPYSLVTTQAMAACIGLPLMLVAAQLPPRAFRPLAGPALLVAILALIAVLFIGESYNTGATQWLEIGGMTVQPSEPAKFAFALWGANLLARKEELRQLTEWRHLLIPLLPGAGAVVMLVILGGDLGTACILLVIFLALLWVVGAPAKLFVGMLGLVGLLVGLMVVAAPYRMSRFTSFLNPEADPTGTGYQAVRGLYALGSGGLLGVGIGGSREKWGVFPHTESDFIFAIIGEEFGLLGTLLVIGLIGLMGYAGLRVATRATDLFTRLAATAITAWIVFQALVNIGAVINLLPITGVPLPLVSYGGSSLVSTMVAVGMLLAFAKREPGARQALAARGPGPARRALSWLGLEVRGDRLVVRREAPDRRRTPAPRGRATQTPRRERRR
ncbi:putative lipid II flippase FtsW [Allonocardiopsis opalescens]|uniref:Probable peptidoglycan glycosyltransferase FtsW n=1 Tax=Allonocardiopsis opalescens TaxID=1144618 RepID=A0A2T0Q3W6_9ACTN|nr:putative lipid II flippase FtsW [Allonocardiopsis opalescens]PRX98487.1 cell division-specific peptidoglycan biosynthesis regulator FtsW [Allonocardiopsis opalescens]